MKFYSNKADDFHDEKVPKIDSKYTCLVVISLDSIFEIDEKYYLEVFLKECKYIEKERG